MTEKKQEVDPSRADLDFTKLAEASARQPAPSPEKLAEAEHEATTGASELGSKGYYACLRRAKNPPSVAPGEKYQILLIDDDANFAGILQKMLSMAGYAVRTASNRVEIVAALNSPTLPHLVILDVGLAEISGFDLLAGLRRTERWKSVPVIMLTGYTSRKDVTRGLLNGADGYLAKPCRLLVLTHAIRTVLGVEQFGPSP